MIMIMKTVAVYLLLLIVAQICICDGSTIIDLVYTRKVLSPDSFAKPVIMVNGQFPGPVIRTSVSATLHIRVKNMILPLEDLSIHWHGIHQINTSWADGAEGVNGCPIPYGHNFTYSFTTDAAGTYWYHPHGEAGLRADGGYGFLIVNETTPLASYDEERFVILTDWYHQNTKYISQGLLNYGPSLTTPAITGFLFPGTGDSILMNGVGLRYNSIPVQSGKIYRFRVLNVAALAYLNFAIAGHNLTVIRFNEAAIAPVTFSSLDLAAGQRADCLVDTKGMSPASYPIAAITNWRGVEFGLAGHGGSLRSAYLQYTDTGDSIGGGSVLSSLNPKNESKPWDAQTGLQPLTPSPTAIPMPTRFFVFNTSQQYTNASTFRGLDLMGINRNGYLRWAVNQQSFEVPQTPLQLSSYFNLPIIPLPQIAPIKIALGDVVQIIIQNRVALNGVCEAHPWHIHGFSFWVLGYGEGEYSDTRDGPLLNTVNPVTSDTVVSFAAGPYSRPRNDPKRTFSSSNAHKPCGWVALRFVASHAGMWLMHCHVEWHQMMGMEVVFDVQNELLRGTPLPAGFPLCGDARGFSAASPSSSSPTSSSSSYVRYLGDGEIAAVVVTVTIAFLVITAALLFAVLRLRAMKTSGRSALRRRGGAAASAHIDMEDVDVSFSVVRSPFPNDSPLRPTGDQGRGWGSSSQSSPSGGGAADSVDLEEGSQGGKSKSAETGPIRIPSYDALDNNNRTL